MKNDLPPYFKEYFEEKFTGLDMTIKKAFDTYDKEIADLNSSVTFLNQKYWIAIGALAIISIVGGTFAFMFKELNKNQIIDAVGTQIEPVKRDVDTIKKTLSDYDIKVINN